MNKCFIIGSLLDWLYTIECKLPFFLSLIMNQKMQLVKKIIV